MAQAKPQDPQLLGALAENAVRIQIYVALIAYLLLNILRKTAACSFKASTALLLTQLKLGLFRPLDLRRTHKPPPRPPSLRPPPPQLALALA